MVSAAQRAAPFQVTNHDFHADMAADALYLRDRQQRKGNHRGFDYVDVTEYRRAEDRAQNDLQHAQKHQAENQHPGQQVQRIFNGRKQPVGSCQQPAQPVIMVR